MEHSPFRVLVPFLATAGNLLLGLVSLVLAASGRFEGTAWCIVYSAILDKADGTLARALGVQGTFGMEMDSFADYTAFGIAPGTLTWFYASATGLEGFPLVLAALAALAMPLAAATRLARFNTFTHEDPLFFQGVPTTLIGGLVATLFLSLIDLGVRSLIVAQAMIPACLVGALLMVERVRIPKMRRHGRRWKDIGQWLVIGMLTVLAVFQKFPEVHFLLGSAYVSHAFLRHGRVPRTASEPPISPGGQG